MPLKCGLVRHGRSNRPEMTYVGADWALTNKETNKKKTHTKLSVLVGAVCAVVCTECGSFKDCE